MQTQLMGPPHSQRIAGLPVGDGAVPAQRPCAISRARGPEPELGRASSPRYPEVMTTADSVTALVEVGGSEELAAPRAPSHPEAARLGLSRYDRAAASALAAGDTEALEEHVRAHAASLAAAGGHEARVRTLARAAARASMALSNLEELLGRALAERDEQGVRMLERLLRTTTARLVALTGELRREEREPQQRPSVVVAQASHVHVSGVR